MGYVPIIDTNVILYSHLLVSPFPLLFLNFAKSSLSPGDVLSFLGEGGGGFGFLPPGFACKWEKAKEKEGRGGGAKMQRNQSEINIIHSLISLQSILPFQTSSRFQNSL